MAVGVLGITIVTGPVADAHHAVVTVYGTTIDRTALRGRIALDGELREARAAVLRTASNAGLLTPEVFARLLSDVEGEADDPLRAAVDGLVRDQVIRDAARAEGLLVAPDLDAAFTDAAISLLATHVWVVTIAQPYADPPSTSGDWPRPAPMTAAEPALDAARSAAAARAMHSLESGMAPIDIVAALRAAGWRAAGSDRWLPASGAVADLPDVFVTAMRGSDAGATHATYDDPWSGVTAIGLRLSDTVDGTTAAASIDRSKIDTGALQSWAEARAAERALRARFADRWSSEPGPRTRVAEVVVGPADLDGAPGPYRSFAHVVVRQLGDPIRVSGETDDALAARLATELRALSPVDRDRRVAVLVAAANATPSSDPLTRSGELGYFTKDQLLPDLAAVAFAADVAAGTVLDPVTTIVGPEIFVVRGAFDGTLDDRTIAALVEARTTSDLAALARRISPTGAARRSTGTLWRADAEVAFDPTVLAAFTETPIGGRSDPVVIDGQIVVVVPLERVTGPYGRDVLDRLLARGFEAWLTGRLATADIVRDREPLPGVVVESDAPSTGPSDSPPASEYPGVTAPLDPSSSPRPFPLATPPVIP